MIKQIHLNQCDSTQDVLKEQLMKESHKEVMIISCEHQLSGRGRGTNQWMSMPGTICFSMNLKPHPVLSFTAMEMAVIICRFFSLKGKELSLKWPNDLWDSQRKKSGGILIQVHQEILLVGIGLNLFSENLEFGSILDFNPQTSINKEMWSKEIGEFIFHNRITETPFLKTLWRQRCGHLNQRVSILDGEKEVQGIFQDIGEYGEALILTQDGVNKIYNGSLRFI